MEKLTKSKVVLHSIALFAIMFLGDFLGSIPMDILFRFITIPKDFEWMYEVLRSTACIVMTVLLFHVYSKRILGSTLSFFRISRPKVKLMDIALALFLPSIVIVFYISMGQVSVSEILTGSGIISVIISSLFRALKAGILEEMFFRGFILKLVESKWNKYVAIIAPSLIFSLVHIPSMETFSFMGLLLLVCSGTLVGAMFSLIAYRNDSIWGSVLVHVAWNFAIVGRIFYFGKEAKKKVIFSVVSSNDSVLLTGGDFGVEASIIAIAAYIAISIIVLLTMKKSGKTVLKEKHIA